MFLSGEPVVLKSPADAIAHGIGMVHQELMLIPHLTVAENITLGQEARTRSGRLKKQEASRSIRELAASPGKFALLDGAEFPYTSPEPGVRLIDLRRQPGASRGEASSE